jgi:ribosomal protein S18 acetylase RimI-like enzyme
MTPSSGVIKNLKMSDLAGVADVHLAAFPDSALTMLGREAVRRYYEWQLVGPHDITALGAFIGQEIKGFCFGGIFRGALSGFLRKNRPYLIWQVLTHPQLVSHPIFRERLNTGLKLWGRGGKPGRSAPVEHRGEIPFDILSIAVHPGSQGLGLGKLLLTEIESVARQRGFREMDLTVRPENHQALRFYESLKWEKTPTQGAWQGAMRKSLSC